MKINKVNNKKCRGLIGKEYQKGMPNYAQNNRILKFDVGGRPLASTHAITLISLVITIVILIILSSIAIYLSLGNNGIFTRAKQAKEVTNKQEATDIINLKITTAQMNKYAEKQEMPTLQELADALYEDNEIQYVALETKVGEKEKITVGNNTSIFTKLNQYPYEFEINSSLQLASINGVKIATNNTNNISNEMKYSTDEKIVGEWIDGKPIYQKTYILNNLSGTGSENDNIFIIDENAKNYVDTFVNSEFRMTSFLQNSQIANDYEFIRDGQFAEVWWRPDIGFCIFGNFKREVLVCHITVRYTKLTD